jgi:hypothetical protein
MAGLVPAIFFERRKELGVLSPQPAIAAVTSKIEKSEEKLDFNPASPA